MIASLLIFLFTYTFIAFRNIPGLPIDMTAGALIGAVLMVGSGTLSLQEAYVAIDWNTILLLLGMMLVVAYLGMSGFFERIAALLAAYPLSPFSLLVIIILVSGLLSAFLVNDTVCLFLTPMLLPFLRARGLSPIPYLIALATASNIGGQMSIMGNPQNMFIGNHAGISFGKFLLALAPISFIGLILEIVVIGTLYRRALFAGPVAQPKIYIPSPSFDEPLLLKTVAVIAVMLILFFFGWPYPLVTIGGAALLFLIGGKQPALAFRKVDWTLLVFFASLFVVMRGLERAGWALLFIEWGKPFFSGSAPKMIAALSGVALLLSNLVSNVPAVVLLEPFVKTLSHPTLGWLTLAMSSTLAGNLTIVGSVANLIVVSLARPEVEISFWEYFKVGVILTFITIAVGIGILILEADRF